MSETYPRKTHCETLFAGHTPSSIGFGYKGSEKFADVQIFQLKVYSLSCKGECASAQDARRAMGRHLYLQDAKSGYGI